MNTKRIRTIKEAEYKGGCVVYWMSRDQRANDNWALLYAQQRAIEANAPLAVVFCSTPSYYGSTVRHYTFMTSGLEDVEKELKKKNIGFYAISGFPNEKLPEFLDHLGAGLLVTDFMPLRTKIAWEKEIAKKTSIPFEQVDAHNIVPCWEASDKQEYAAYTFRPKIRKKLVEYLDEFPKLKKHPVEWHEHDHKYAIQKLHTPADLDAHVKAVEWLQPGEAAAKNAVSEFLDNRIDKYAAERNDPNMDGQSELSPYLHFGQLSAQRLVLEVNKREEKSGEATDAFLEELIVRRELSDNYCYYNEQYDSLEGFPDWAKKTLLDHVFDKREAIYSLDQFERAQTHDDLWNAAQLELIHKGKIHGYMRMYWAKKILEWSHGPEEAQRTALLLNDKYELDGNDPNGFVGVAWSIGGLHDRAWKERAIFGKVRYMSETSMRRKFDVKRYIEYAHGLNTNGK